MEPEDKEGLNNDTIISLLFVLLIGMDLTVYLTVFCIFLYLFNVFTYLYRVSPKRENAFISFILSIWEKQISKSYKNKEMHILVRTKNYGARFLGIAPHQATYHFEGL